MLNPATPAARTTSALVAGIFAVTTVAIGFQRAARAQGGAGTETQRVLLLPMQRGDDVSSLVPGRVHQYLKTILEMNDGLEFLSPQTLEVPGDGEAKVPEADPTLAKADEALWKAKDLANEGEYMEAARTFEEARNLYRERFDRLEDFDKFVDASLGVALAYFMAGYDDNGEDALLEVMVLRPDLVLDKRKAPSAAIDALERLRRIYQKSDTGEVTLDSDPPGAKVFVDGVAVGETPYVAGDLWRGRHVVRVLEDGYEPAARTFVADGRERTVKLSLKAVEITGDAPLPQTPEALAAAVGEGHVGPRFREASAALCERYALDAIVATYIREGPADYDLATFLYDAEEDAVAELEWVHLDQELATMQVNLLILEEKLLAALSAFPASRVLTGPSRIFAPVEPPAPEPAPAAAPTPTPAPRAEPEPAPATEPTPTPAPRAEPEPEPASTAEPTPRPASAVRVRPEEHVDDASRPGLGDYDYRPRPEPEPRVRATEPDDDRAWYRKWWVWTLVGGAVAGGAAAAVLVTQSGDDDPNSFSATVNW